MSEYYYTPTRSYHSSVSDSIPPPQPWSPHAYGNESYESAPGEQHFAGPTGPFDASTSQAYHCQEHSDAEYGEYGDLDYPPSGYARAGGYLPPTPSELQDTDTEGPISPTWDASELSPTVTYASFSLMTHGGRESVEASQTPDNGYGDMIGNRQYSTDTLTSHALYCHAAHPHPVASEDAKMFLAYPEQQYDLPIDRRQPAQDEYANFADYGDQMQGVDQMSPVFPVAHSVKLEEDEGYVMGEAFAENAAWDGARSHPDVKPFLDVEPPYSPDTMSPDSPHLHDLWPIPQTHRSYTLANAMLELRPRTPQHNVPGPKQEVIESPPMASLQPGPVDLSAQKPQPRPRGRPRKTNAKVAKAPSPRPVAYPFPQLPAGPSAGPSTHAAPSSSTSAEPAATPSFGQVPMSLDEVPIQDRDIKPGQSIFKLNMASTEKEPVKKKPIMACLFCRERKIACGPALPDNPDQRCNQCARRSLQCIYPKESRRGQHKRGPRAAKVRALLEGASGSGSELGTKTAASASSGSPCAGSSSYTGPSSPTVSPVPKPRAGKERERSASSTRAPRNPQLAAARRAVYRQQRKLVVQAREGELCGADAAGTPSASSTSSM